MFEVVIFLDSTTLITSKPLEWITSCVYAMKHIRKIVLNPQAIAHPLAFHEWMNA